MLERGGSVRRFDLSRGRVASDPERDVARRRGCPRPATTGRRASRGSSPSLPLIFLRTGERGEHGAREDGEGAETRVQASTTRSLGVSETRFRVRFPARSPRKKNARRFCFLVRRPLLDRPTETQNLNKYRPFGCQHGEKNLNTAKKIESSVAFVGPALRVHTSSQSLFSEKLSRNFSRIFPGLKTHPQSGEVDLRASHRVPPGVTDV